MAFQTAQHMYCLTRQVDAASKSLSDFVRVIQKILHQVMQLIVGVFIDAVGENDGKTGYRQAEN
jgi:hypothetical protein